MGDDRLRAAMVKAHLDTPALSQQAGVDWIETMPRTDYFNDPHAPTPNSLVPAASAIVVSEPGELLLRRRFDNDQ